MTRTHDQEWLVKNALFSCCNDSCREEQSYHYTELSVDDEGNIWCDTCYDYERNDGMKLWEELRAFNPFATTEAR